MFQCLAFYLVFLCWQSIGLDEAKSASGRKSKNVLNDADPALVKRKIDKALKKIQKLRDGARDIFLGINTKRNMKWNKRAAM